MYSCGALSSCRSLLIALGTKLFLRHDFVSSGLKEHYLKRRSYQRNGSRLEALFECYYAHLRHRDYSRTTTVYTSDFGFISDSLGCFPHRTPPRSWQHVGFSNRTPILDFFKTTVSPQVRSLSYTVIVQWESLDASSEDTRQSSRVIPYHPVVFCRYRWSSPH